MSNLKRPATHTLPGNPSKLSATASPFPPSPSSSSLGGSAPGSSSGGPKLASIFGRQSAKESPGKWDKQFRGCIHFTWGEPTPSAKVASFDLDGTVIKVKSGAKFPKDELDWDWWNASVPGKIQAAHAQGFAIVFISNQAGHAKQQNAFKNKLPLIGAKLGVPFHAFAALAYDEFRKPSPGMWERYLSLCHPSSLPPIDYASSFYVGDAAGRPAGPARQKDHNDTDRKMALNAGLPFLTPEEYFLGQGPDLNFAMSGWDPSTYKHPPLSPSPALVPSEGPGPELVLFVGMPGVGKSSFFARHFSEKGYERVNQDTLKTRQKCLRVAEDLLREGKKVVVDNTNPSREVRREWLDLAKGLGGVKTRVGWFVAEERIARQNSVYRALSGEEEREVLPGIAFVMYAKGFKQPSLQEGFDEIVEIPFEFSGTDEERKRWGRWLDCYPKGNWAGR